MKATIQASSSSGGSYPVEFSDEDGALRVFCHCQAGSLQQLCKHKLGLLKGDSQMLFNKADEGLLKQVLSSEAFAVLKLKIDQFEASLGSIEHEAAKLKAREKALKRDFAYELTFGKPRG